MTSVARELVRIAVQEYAQGEYDAALALADPLVRWDDRALSADGELTWGREDVLDVVEEWFDSWENYSAEIGEVREVEGGRVVVTYRESGTESRRGCDLEQDRAAVVAVERGAIVAWSRYLTEREAERAAEASSGRVERF